MARAKQGRSRLNTAAIQGSVRKALDRFGRERAAAATEVISLHGRDVWHWLKRRGNAVASREKMLDDAYGFGDQTFVDRSSVASEAGNGLYALRTFDSGCVLPMKYPGIRLGLEEHDSLENFLVAQTQRAKETWTVDLVLDTLSVLRNRWNITFFQTGSGRTPPDWDRLYDNFVAYRFRVDDPGCVWCWNVYEWSGNIHALGTTPSNAALFINEPGVAPKFINRLHLKEQLSVPNVEAFCGKDGVVRFRAIRKIRKFDEFLLDYGKAYSDIRNYATTVDSRSRISDSCVFRCESIDEDLLINEIETQLKG